MENEPLCPIEYRYGRSATRDLFSREAFLGRCLAVEAALARSLAEEHLIPPAGARAIARAVSEGRVKLARVAALEEETRHDVMAIVKALSEVSGPGAPYVHMGATSNDVLDTARGLEMREAADVLSASLESLIQALERQAIEHRGTLMVGRTHGQQAVPTTFGYKLVNFLLEFDRHAERLRQLTPRLSVGKMSGAVGTGAGFGPKAARIESRTLGYLGLGVEEAPTQITGRDRLAEFVVWMALVGSTLDRLATEVRNLQRSEIGELMEPFDEAKQVGSSTMAQKRNPINSENVSSLARLLRAFPQTALENMVSWHERDLANSANERFLFSHGVILLDEMLGRMTRVVAGWHVNRDRMRENLESSGGSVMSEHVMLELTRRGIPRQEAHELLRTLTRDLRPEEGDTLAVRASRSPEVLRWVKRSEVPGLFDPRQYAKAAEQKATRILNSRRRRPLP